MLTVVKILISFLMVFLLIAMSQTNSAPATAEELSNEELLDRIKMLEQQLEEMENIKQEVRELHELLSKNQQATQEAGQKAEQASRVASQAEQRAVYPEVQDTIWHLAGYASVGMEFQTKSDQNDFLSGQFNPVFHFQFRDIILFEGELEIEVDEDGNTEFGLEYAQINVLAHNNAVVVIGKYLSPVGQFQERLHPSWINKFTSAPAGFGHDGVQPISDVGAQIRGGVAIGERSRFSYVFAVGNGPRMNGEGLAVFEGFGNDDNNNKSIGGRISILPFPYLEIGGSYLEGDVTGLEAPAEVGHVDSLAVQNEEDHLEPTSASVKVFGFDAAFTKGPWDVRFEFLKSVRDPINSFEEEEEEIVMLPKLTQKAWYAQIAYRLSELSDSPFIHRLEPAFRFGKVTAEGNHHLEEHAHKRTNLGLNYWIAPSAVAKFSVEWRKFFDEETLDEFLVQLQVAYGF